MVVIGVLAIQGAVEEHAIHAAACGAVVKEIRLPQDFAGVDGIILPGGESTTMAIVGEEWGLFPILKEWVAVGKPIWGTCAGMILLSNTAVMQQTGGQALVGGLDVQVCRNFFGSQVHSCELQLEATSADYKQLYPCSAVFIRAPAILQAGPAVDIIATVKSVPHVSARKQVYSIVDPSSPLAPESRVEPLEVIVAVKQSNILATAFHPELTPDTRWHKYFIDMVHAHKVAS